MARTSSVGTLECKAGGRGFDSQGRTITRGGITKRERKVVSLPASDWDDHVKWRSFTSSLIN